MIFSRQINTDWVSNIWEDRRILDFTSKIFNRDVRTYQDSMDDFTKILDCDVIDFVQYFIQRYRRPRVGCPPEYRYRIRIEYYLEDECTAKQIDTASNNQEKIEHFFEVLDDIIVENHNPNWSADVLAWVGTADFPDIRFNGLIENRPIYVGSFEYITDINFTA